jgi:hypothetical protein
VKDGRRVYRTQPIKIRVGKPDEEPILLSKVKADFETVFVGQSVDITLEILIRKFRDGRVTLDARSLWGLYDKRTTRFGVFSQVQSVETGERTLADDDGIEHDYFVYSLETPLKPTRAGPIDLGNIEFAINYPVKLGRDLFGRVDRDLFGRVSIANRKWLRTQPEMPPLTAKPIPEEGRPPGYSGAIGAYSISARAVPKEVPVGDPITLTLSISGKGGLEQLSAPRLDRVEALTRDFEISSASLAGEIKGSRKLFSQTIRALREDVTEIPSIPMSFLNPDTGRFETVHSKPISITVKPAERLALPQLSGPGSVAPVLAPLVETTEGLLPNYDDPAGLLADQSGGLGMPALALLVVMPALYWVTWFVQRRAARYRDDVAWRRRSRAYSAAKKALRSSPGPATPGQVRTALIGYVADRCNVPTGGLTRADAVKLIAGRGAPAGTVQAFDALLESLEQTQYGGGTNEREQDGAASARRLMDVLEQCRLK